MSVPVGQEPAGPEEILDEVARVLHEMVELTCPAMETLWLAHSLDARRSLVDAPVQLPPGLPGLELSKASLAKYRALAGWRHCVVWRGLHKEVNTKSIRAMEGVYFRPYQPDRPPFSWSQRTSEILDRNEPVARARKQAAVGCMMTIEQLFQWRQSDDLGPRLEFVDLGLSASLVDVLKLGEQLDSKELDCTRSKLMNRGGGPRGGPR